MTTSQDKAIAALRKAEQGVFSRVSAYVVIPTMIDKYRDDLAHTLQYRYGKIKVALPAKGEGKLQVWVWDCSGKQGLQYGSASGYGYDKLSAAMAGLKFDDIVFTDHPVNWEKQLRDAGYTIIQAV